MLTPKYLVPSTASRIGYVHVVSILAFFDVSCCTYVNDLAFLGVKSHFPSMFLFCQTVKILL